MSTPKTEILAPEYGALFVIHQILQDIDSDVKDNKNRLQVCNFLSENRRT
jgi:hypothetical protein